MTEQLIINHLSTLALTVQNKSAAGRGSSKKIDLYGIKKLRELILELAVRGKLVPQNPEDEPASKLLERIEAEKARLVKEKLIKKQKALPAITDDEKPFKLPDGWEWVRLGEITNYGVSEKAESSDVEECTWVLELEDVEKVTSKLLQRVRFKDRQFKSSKNRFNAGDVIYGKLRPYLDKVLVADESGVCTTEMIPFRAHAAISSAYLRMVMKSPYFISYANESTHGMNLPRMGTDKARLALIPIVSENQQHCIVTKVDELMALCDQIEQQTETSLSAHTTLVENLLGSLLQPSAAAEGSPTSSANADELKQNWQRIASHFTTLFTTEASIDLLKQTILQLAVMGKLVPQDPSDEPAAKLLERIAAEKAQLVKEGKIKKQKALPAITEDEKPFELPDGWEWCRLAELVTIRGGKRVSNGYKLLREPTPYVYIRVADMKGGTIDDSDLHYIDAQMRQKINQYIITKDDIYMTIVGATIGKCGLVPDRFDQMNLTENAARLTPSTELSKSFLYKCLDSDFCQNQFIDKTKQVGVQKMALNRLASTLIPLPPANEALSIEKKVDELMTLCDQIKTHLQHQQQTRLHLADAMVEQAINPTKSNPLNEPKAVNL